ncbi:hypothetical protein HHL19_16470 [Streptomyces sp. R302]|uniref:hypothetical protein n=1 Tax=unclassified Streptomyces TaxID=2593676 RepID=UPI00145E23E4|nr:MULTISPECIES: hypothetical protein [unclassified Streptomyces]NML55364.1 hypothetical protein [Streptomyces sp. R301]NML80236.1 hypothetical protein [Streptomyces sp. R302]
MIDPTSAAASAGTRAIASALLKKSPARLAPRLGGREERRGVYARYSHAHADAASFAQALRMEKKFASTFMGQGRMRTLLAMTQERQTELLSAYLEVRLVANPGPLAAADDLMSATSNLMDTGPSFDEHAFGAALEKALEAHRAFTDRCREDLWYAPRWWQLYRVGWWSARWKWVRGK